jgi:hypothetical protein
VTGTLWTAIAFGSAKVCTSAREACAGFPAATIAIEKGSPPSWES